MLSQALSKRIPRRPPGETCENISLFVILYDENIDKSHTGEEYLVSQILEK